MHGSVMLPCFNNYCGHEAPQSQSNGFGLTALPSGLALSDSFAVRIGKRTLFDRRALCRTSG
jgi:hypothetical protein